METHNKEQKRPELQQEQKKSRLERWIEKLEERIAPCSLGNQHYNPQGKLVGSSGNCGGGP